LQDDIKKIALEILGESHLEDRNRRRAFHAKMGGGKVSEASKGDWATERV